MKTLKIIGNLLLVVIMLLGLVQLNTNTTYAIQGCNAINCPLERDIEGNWVCTNGAAACVCFSGGPIHHCSDFCNNPNLCDPN